MKKEVIKIIVLILVFLTLAGIVIVYDYKKDMANKQAIMDILEIKDSKTFTLIYVKKSFEFQSNDGSYYEIRFEISTEDYENNKLHYNEESYTEVLECNYKEKKDENTYTCIKRISNIYSEELYKKIKNLNI